MESAANSPGKFDVYVRRLGKASSGLSGVLAAMWLFIGCGGIAAALLSIAQILLLSVILWLPLLWRRIRGMMLDELSAKWVLIASVSVFAVLLLAEVFDSTGKHGCFR
jgi:hypothetical protein